MRPLFLLFFALMIFAVATRSNAVAARGSKKATPTPPPSAQDILVDRERRRLEELFIWKISEELKLPVEMETPFAEAIRSLNREKARANADVARALEDLNQAQNAVGSKARVETERAVRKYEFAWKTYGALPIREVSRMRAIIGSERLGKYLIAKSQMAEKLKALSSREANEQESSTDNASAPAASPAAKSTPKSSP